MICLFSDFHLGMNVDGLLPDADRIKRFVKTVRAMPHLEELHLVGDVFEVWFEYREVVPRGYSRLLGFLCDLVDSGVKVYYYKGNHDMWILDYLEKEVGMQIIDTMAIWVWHGKRFLIAHGDFVGEEPLIDRISGWLFRNRVAQGLYRLLHPDIGIKIARFIAMKSKKATEPFNGENEIHIKYCRKLLSGNNSPDFFIMGHRHIPLIYQLEKGKYYVNIGDWFVNFSWVEVNERGLALRSLSGLQKIVPFSPSSET